ncbi:MAG: hypothetical protein ABGW77_01880 [Campylobacterales bacterium]
MELNLVVAHWGEGREIIKKFQLKRDGKFWRKGGLWLAITGVGVPSATIGTFQLLSQHRAPLLNFGVAGSDTHNLGEGFWVTKIEEGVGGRSFYPGLVGPKGEVLRTLLTPTEYFRLVDLEGAGVFEGGIRHLSSHWLSFYKVVSDTPAYPFQPAQLPSLLAPHLWVVEWCWEMWKGDWEELQRWEGVEKEVERWITLYREKVHLTFTQLHQLRDLLRGLLLWGVPPPPPPETPLSKQEGKKFLKELDFLLRSRIEVGGGC